jgi:hypothetical protein
VTSCAGGAGKPHGTTKRSKQRVRVRPQRGNHPRARAGGACAARTAYVAPYRPKVHRKARWEKNLAGFVKKVVAEARKLVLHAGERGRGHKRRGSTDDARRHRTRHTSVSRPLCNPHTHAPASTHLNVERPLVFSTIAARGGGGGGVTGWNETQQRTTTSQSTSESRPEMTRVLCDHCGGVDWAARGKGWAAPRRAAPQVQATTMASRTRNTPDACYTSQQPRGTGSGLCPKQGRKPVPDVPRSMAAMKGDTSSDAAAAAVKSTTYR